MAYFSHFAICMKWLVSSYIAINILDFISGKKETHSFAGFSNHYVLLNVGFKTISRICML